MLRHYDSGKCKGKLGHTRASLLWHRAQGNLLRGIDKKTIRKEGMSIYSLFLFTFFKETKWFDFFKGKSLSKAFIFA